MNETYTLYGSYASYYTAKVRSYLRKKAIPFVERLPSDPVFRSQVRPASGSHRIPQLQTPTGEVLQDSITIVDFLEARFPQLPAIPTTPNQRVFVHLMELLASEGLLSLAWRHRWLFEENKPFITLDFGRSFRPQGSDADLLKYGALISGSDDRLRIAAVYRGGPRGAGRRVSRPAGCCWKRIFCGTRTFWAASQPKRIIRLWGRSMRTWDATRRACG